jgi:RNA polymerase sigma-70 factor, ECF subfamily
MAQAKTSGEQGAPPSVDPDHDPTQQRLDSLMIQHQDFLRGLARKLCRSTFDSEDLVQDVLLKTVANFDRLPPDVNHAAWMARVMRNLFVDRVRARASAPTPVDVDDVTLSAPSPDERAWWEDLSSGEVRAAVLQLPEELRVAFERFTFQRQTYKEIALALGVPVATVGTRVLRARRRLRALLGGTTDE